MDPTPKTYRTPAGLLRYTDVGTGPPLVFLHGNPTSARLYRYLISDLADDHRCIAPDYLGFGRSEAPADFSYRPPAHAAVLEGLLERLDLENATFVLHDWGGPLGLAYALRHPRRVRALVLMNTWAWPLSHRPLIQAASRILGSRLGRLAVERGNAFAHVVMPATAGRSEAIYPAWIPPYVRALNTRPRRRACWAFARALRTESTWLRTLWSHRDRLRDRPVLLCWGMADPAFGTDACLRKWQSAFSPVAVHRYHSVGHYVPEEVETQLAGPIRAFLAST